MANRPNGNFLDRLERRLAARTSKIFRKQLAYILEETKKLSVFNGDQITNDINDEIDGMLNKIPGQMDMAEEIVATARVGMDRGGKYIVKELDLGKFGISWSLQNTAALKFLGGKLTHELSNYRGNISGTTKKNISKIILEAAQKGESYQKTAKKIQEQGKVGVFSRKRAELIAIRETGVAYEQGKGIMIHEVANKFPEETIEKYWQTVNDNKVTPSHTLNQEQGWIGVSEFFTGTGDYQAPASDNPRCRCAVKYRIK